jgi:hypothetical protein
MFEPHRRQEVLLRAAYSQVLPELRRLGSSRPSVDDRQGEWVGDVERKRAE